MQMTTSSFRATIGRDEKILSFGDVVLYTSDLHTLDPGMWLNDNIITFACEFLFSKASEEVKREIAIVSAATCQLIEYCGDMDIVQEIFNSLEIYSKDKILFVLNDRDDPSVVGGCHWSLLVFESGKSRFEYYDSIRPAKVTVARQIVSVVGPLLAKEETSFVVVDCHQQRNSFDCGMYVIEFIRQQLKLAEPETDIYQGMEGHSIELIRRHWQDVIYSLSKNK